MRMLSKYLITSMILKVYDRFINLCEAIMVGVIPVAPIGR